LHDRRFGDTKQLAAETAAWSTSSNEKQRGVDWQFQIDDARTKLKSLYPKVSDLRQSRRLEKGGTAQSG